MWDFKLWQCLEILGSSSRVELEILFSSGVFLTASNQKAVYRQTVHKKKKKIKEKNLCVERFKVHLN